MLIKDLKKIYPNEKLWLPYRHPFTNMQNYRYSDDDFVIDYKEVIIQERIFLFNPTRLSDPVPTKKIRVLWRKNEGQ